MILNEFIALGVEQEISFEEAQRLNSELASMCLDDIPPFQREMVNDYLERAFLFESIGSSHRDKLEALVAELQLSPQLDIVDAQGSQAPM